MARAADRSGSGSSGSGKAACPFALVVKALSKHDTEGLGFVKVILLVPGNAVEASYGWCRVADTAREQG